MALENFKYVHLTSTDQASEEGTKQAGEPRNEAELHNLPSVPRAFRHCWEWGFSGFLG